MSTETIISLVLTGCTIFLSTVAVLISLYEVRKQNKLNLIDRRLKIVRKVEINFDGALALVNNLDEFIFNELLSESEKNDMNLTKQIQLATYLQFLIGTDSYNQLNLSKNKFTGESIYKDYLFLINEFNINRESFAVFKKKSLEQILSFSYLFFFSLIFIFRDFLVSQNVDEEAIEPVNVGINVLLKKFNFEEYNFTTESLLTDLKELCSKLFKEHFLESLYKETSVFNNKKN